MSSISGGDQIDPYRAMDRYGEANDAGCRGEEYRPSGGGQRDSARAGWDAACRMT